MYVIKQHSYPSAPRYVASHSFVPGVPTKWTATIDAAAHVGSKRLASLYVADIPDTVYIKLAYVIAQLVADRVYYIEKIIGPQTASWTDEIDKALKVGIDDAMGLAMQYDAAITEVES